MARSRDFFERGALARRHLDMRLVVLLVFVAACAPSAAPGSSTTEASFVPSTTSTTKPPSTTTTESPPPDAMGLYRVDAATLEPLPGTAPLITGWDFSGQSSPNGEWVAVEVWSTSAPRHVTLVIESSTGEIVTDKTGILGDFLGVGDDGIVYQMPRSQIRGHNLRRLVPGGEEYHEVDVDFPQEFSSWMSVFLGPQRIALLGKFGENPEDQENGVVVVDLETLRTTTYLIDGLAIGRVGEVDLGDWSAADNVWPFMVWDSGRDRVIVVHGDEDAVTTLDLGTGELETHRWSQPTSWHDDLLAWLMPPAQAKGRGSPEFGVTRTAALSQSGKWLYVATSITDAVIESGGAWSVSITPRGVEAIDTEMWEVAHHWRVPASDVSLSPDGKHLVATGTAWIENATSANVQSKEVVVIDTESRELVGQFSAFEAWHDVQYSPDGNYIYLGTCCGNGRVDIVDVATLDVVERSQPGVLFGDALLLATRAP